MEKKQFETPELKIYKMNVKPNLLAGSGSEEEESSGT